MQTHVCLTLNSIYFIYCLNIFWDKTENNLLEFDKLEDGGGEGV